MDTQSDQPPGANQPQGDSPPSPGPYPGQSSGPTPQYLGPAPQHSAPAPQHSAPAPQHSGQPPPVPDQPPVIAATSTGRPRVRPGRVWYLAALAVLLGGVAWIVFGLISVDHQVDSFPRVPLPAGGTVTLDHNGGYVVYYEGPGASAGRIPTFNARVSPAAPPAAVGSPHPYTASVTYSFARHQGRAVLTLQVTHPGRFLVEPSGAPAVPGGSDLAFGSSIAGRIVGTVLPSIGLIFLGIIGAIVVGIVRITRVRRARAQGF
jgi:hypothetical protein